MLRMNELTACSAFSGAPAAGRLSQRTAEGAETNAGIDRASLLS
jgi:hypothetical protein